MVELPSWKRGTPGVLCVEGPHAIPVSTIVPGPGRILMAIGRRRETLARLRESPETALCVLASGSAFTAYGPARVIAERMQAADHVVAVELHVERVQDHLADGLTEMIDGARWRWCDERARETEPAIVAELGRLATASG